MTLADMAKYLNAHATRDPEFLAPETWDVLHRAPFEATYALGWFLPNADTLWHNGSNTMWYAEASLDRSTKRLAVVAVNDGTLTEVPPVVRPLLTRLLKGDT